MFAQDLDPIQKYIWCRSLNTDRDLSYANWSSHWSSSIYLTASQPSVKSARTTFVPKISDSRWWIDIHRLDTFTGSAVLKMEWGERSLEDIDLGSRNLEHDRFAVFLYCSLSPFSPPILPISLSFSFSLFSHYRWIMNRLFDVMYIDIVMWKSSLAKRTHLWRHIFFISSC